MQVNGDLLESESQPNRWSVLVGVDRKQSSSAYLRCRLLNMSSDYQSGNMQIDYMWSEVIAPWWSHLKREIIKWIVKQQLIKDAFSLGIMITMDV